MTYTGVVTAGGPGDVRETSGLTITKVSVGTIDNNAYLLRCRATGEQLLIDAAAEPETLLKLAGDAGLASIVTTHRHWDHWIALEDVATATGARTYAGRDDVEGIDARIDVQVDDGDTIRVGEVELTARHLVGHSPGSIALLYRDPAGTPHLFTGDSLFPGGVGNTEKDASRFASLIDDVERKIFAELPDETWVYPGHGKDTALGAERPSLPEWRARGW
ncbi:MBL fold metallo-hydrolase [Amycolatopsis sp. H20-H5]|uniref:MBL fold metallo-hydrolase n=1 Tax=Amycolatopsis sp. H20-H5 TaxID=3046309 RepID=UPI002DB64B15|nr:MBL fold metallo-hydrolase [Amycolatopsis sp. H20-H5]MEC3981796.1 MBL fold metallo-hydrolase [Amycolatopsis sp. H20-H5]